jgi:hypothetical protein
VQTKGVSLICIDSLIGTALFIIHSAGALETTQKCIHVHTCVVRCCFRAFVLYITYIYTYVRADRWRAIPGIWNEKPAPHNARQRTDCAPNKLFYLCILSAHTSLDLFCYCCPWHYLLLTLSFCGIIELSKAYSLYSTCVRSEKE